MQRIMEDPVVAADGNTYERRAMEDWLQRNHTSPVTGHQLRHTRWQSRPNMIARAAMTNQQLKMSWRG